MQCRVLDVRPDAEFQAALGPDDYDLREGVVAQSLGLLQEIQAVFAPAGRLPPLAF